MMHCRACEAEVPTESVFCPHCGVQLVEEKSGSLAGKAAARLRAGTANQAPRDDDVERELWTGGYSAKAMVAAWLLGGGLTLTALLVGSMLPALAIPAICVSLLVWVILGLILGYRKLNYHYTLSSQRFVHRTGIFVRTTDRIEVIDIDDVTCTQGLFQRMLGVGTIKINSSDHTHPELLLHGIDNVRHVADLMDNARRQERHERALHIEAI